jgi:hypothetical protein
MNDEVVINGKTYVPKDSLTTTKATSLKGMKHVLVRTYSAGVFVGYLQSRKGAEVTLRNARRLWSWKGAASLSQLAVDGVSAPADCKFPKEVDKIDLLGAIEIIETTKKAQDSIAAVKIWSA